ncbi:hypothetical protein ACIBL5_12855 [Streptomyces sp. NPDC050516]|uniref:MmyB family transcriptional regulator n=1 Tax=Streptomyces sp. NPDC050516 TaxID=3365621 RepID=UPI0037B3AE00
MRATAATRRAELDGFVAHMRERSETFRALWDSHDVHERVTGEKRLQVDGVGILRLSFETFGLAGPEGHVLYVYFPRPGGTADEVLRGLARQTGRTAECGHVPTEGGGSESDRNK